MLQTLKFVDSLETEKSKYLENEKYIFSSNKKNQSFFAMGCDMIN